MAELLNDEYETESKSSAVEEVSSEVSCLSGESLAEWRSSEQVENGTPSTSPGYSDSDDDEGPMLKELYNKFTWKIENFNDISKKELRSNIFNVGGYKWYILIYPQGCDVCNHLSLFLCVANYDKLLPGWSHFAQFTIAVTNKEPKKTKYSDTLHRFWKKEHDWGWKKFMELSKLKDGFVVDNVLVIKAQVQVIREKAERPFRCLYVPYRRELLRVYMSNVEQICRRFIEEKRGKLHKFMEDKFKWTGLKSFWSAMDPSAKWRMSREKSSTILKIVVKHFFIEKEVISTLVMESLYSGLKALESQDKAKVLNTEAPLSSLISVDQELFVLSTDVVSLIERAVSEPLPHQPLPAKDDRCTQNRTKDGSSGEDSNKDSCERDDRRLAELGQRTIELFILVHIFSQIEIAYQEAVALRRQEELIREEEAAELANIERKRSIAEKRRSKKKQAKLKRSTRKGKDRVKVDKYDLASNEMDMEEDLSNERMEGELDEALDILKGDKLDVYDISGSGVGVSEVLQTETNVERATSNHGIDDSPDKDLSAVGCSGAVQGQTAKIPARDYASSTLSFEAAVPSDIVAASRAESGSANSKVNPSPHRVTNKRSKYRNMQKLRYGGRNLASVVCDTAVVATSDTSERCRPELENKVDSPVKAEISVELSENRSLPTSLGPEKLKEVPQQVQDAATVNSTSFNIEPSGNIHSDSTAEATSPTSSESSNYANGVSEIEDTTFSVESPPSPTGSATMATSDASLRSPPQAGVSTVPESEAVSSSGHESEEESFSSGNSTTPHMIAVSRPLSAPLVPLTRPAELDASAAQPVPSHSRSLSAAEQLENRPSPSAPTYVPRSYRSAATGWNSTLQPSHSSLNHYQVSDHGHPSVAPPQSAYAPSAHLPPRAALARKDQASFTPEFTFGTFPPESLDNSQWRGSGPVQEASSSSSSNGRSLGTRHGYEIPYTPTKPGGTKQLASVAAKYRPYHPQGQVDEFPHLDIINALLDDEQSHSLQSPDLGGVFPSQQCLPFGPSVPADVAHVDLDPREHYGVSPQLPFASAAAQKMRSRSYSYSDSSPYYDGHEEFGVGRWRPYMADPEGGPMDSELNWCSYEPRGYSGNVSTAIRYAGYRPVR